MHTIPCFEFLAERDREGLSDPDHTRTVTLPDHTTGKHLECESGHTVHIGSDGITWPCDCRA